MRLDSLRPFLLSVVPRAPSRPAFQYEMATGLQRPQSHADKPGRTGDDLVDGNTARDLLIGGAGADRIVGNAAGDFLFTGTTAYDGNEVVMHGIRAEWTAGRNYATRIANPQSTGSDTSFASRLNSNVCLLADVTVFDDWVRDVPTGSAGMDWFWANLDTGVKDKITDLNANAFAADLDFLNW